jgi:hypothetical protein
MTHETNGLPNLTDFSVSGPESFPNKIRNSYFEK